MCPEDECEGMCPSIGTGFFHIPRARFMAEALQRGLGAACLTIDDQSGVVKETEVHYPLLYDNAFCEEELVG